MLNIYADLVCSCVIALFNSDQYITIPTEDVSEHCKGYCSEEIYSLELCSHLHLETNTSFSSLLKILINKFHLNTSTEVKALTHGFQGTVCADQRSNVFWRLSHIPFRVL
jgi:hypothetical protein